MEESKWNPITSPPGRLMPEEMDVLLDELAENNARDMGPYPPVFGPDAFSRERIYDAHLRRQKFPSALENSD